MTTRKARRDDTTAAGGTADSGWGERGVAVAVPADRRVRLPVRLPHRLAGRARRVRGLAVRPPVRLGERVRHAARPRGGDVPVRSVRHQRADRPALRTGHQRARHDVEDPAGLGRGARRADDGAEHRRRHRHAAHAPAHRRRRRTHAGPGGRVPRGTCRDGAGLRARVRLRAGCRRPGRSSTTRVMSPRRPVPTSRCGCTPTCASASKAGRVRGRHVLEAGDRLYCALSWVADLRRAGRCAQTPGRGSTPP